MISIHPDTARRLASALALALAAAAALPAAAVDPLELRLARGRFRITAQWTTAQGTGHGHARRLTDDTGTFWFFRDSNVELTVKVLDACAPPFGRFWIFATGLTNVGVELTVEDTLAGVSHTYVNPLGNSFQPIQDTSTFATCDAVYECGMGTYAEVHATPRPDERAEMGALELGGGLTARPEDYQRVRSDLAVIETKVPQLAGAFNHNFENAYELALILEVPYAYLVRQGIYHDWDCLNSWYGATARGYYHSGYAYVSVYFEGRFDLARLIDEYGELPGVISSGLPGHQYPPELPPSLQFCAKPQGDTFRYFYSDLQGVAWYFTSTPGSPPVLEGTYTGGPFPDWWDDFYSCHFR